MILKRMVLAASTVALLAVLSIGFAQNEPSDSATSDQKNRPTRTRERNQGPRNRVAPAPSRQADRRASAEVTRQRAARTAPDGW
jgi:hypothetical protein